MKDYTFLSILIPEQLRENVEKNTINGMQDAADALGRHMYEGLCANLCSEPHIVNILPISSFPQYYKKPFIKTSSFTMGKRTDHINIGFCNIKLIRNISIEKSIYYCLRAYYKEHYQPGDSVLLIYSAEANLLRAAAKLKEEFPALIICDVIADLPQMSNLSNKKTWLLEKFIEFSAGQAMRALNSIDCFALLTAQMSQYLNLKQPFCVMEGISSLEFKGQKCSDENKKTILYSGTLHERFGILNLLRAFEYIKAPDYRLIICGVGDSEEKIKKAAQKDSRIQFLGRLDRDKVLALQGTATVLVNPRQNNEEFTKYSFPSKILEYLSAGVPVVAYKLDGIPDEYDDYICYVCDDTVEALAKKLIDVCEWSETQRMAFGEKGREFVLSKKNPRAQTKKIIALIDSLA